MCLFRLVDLVEFTYKFQAYQRLIFLSCDSASVGQSVPLIPLYVSRVGSLG
jgi:hypothetical protein